MNEPYQLAFIGVAATNNHIIRVFVIASAIAFSRSSPWANGFTSFASTTLTTTMRVINRVHYHTTNGRTNTAPTIGTSLTNFSQTLLFITHFANSCSAINMDFTNFTRAQAYLGVNTFFSQQDSRSTGRASNLSTFTRLHLNTVNGSSNRNIADGQSIANFNGCFRT